MQNGNDNEYIKIIYQSQTFIKTATIKVYHIHVVFYPHNFLWTSSFLVEHIYNIAV